MTQDEVRRRVLAWVWDYLDEIKWCWDLSEDDAKEKIEHIAGKGLDLDRIDDDNDDVLVEGLAHLFFHRERMNLIEAIGVALPNWGLAGDMTDGKMDVYRVLAREFLKGLR